MTSKELDKWVAYFNNYPAWVICVLEIVIFSFVYSFSNHFVRLGLYPQPPYTYIDKAIPFLDWTILIYNSVFLLMPIGLVWIVRSDRGQSMVSCFILLSIHLTFFLFYPVELSRSQLQPSDTWRWGFEIMWGLDEPRNCFPSLHVALSFLVAFFVLQRRKVWGSVFLVWAVLISLSTLTTEQHFFVDVLGGMITSTVTFWLVFHKGPLEVFDEDV
jgi:membrane-associated phospholipid phosphatase